MLLLLLQLLPMMHILSLCLKHDMASHELPKMLNVATLARRLQPYDWLLHGQWLVPTGLVQRRAVHKMNNGVIVSCKRRPSLPLNSCLAFILCNGRLGFAVLAVKAFSTESLLS